MWRPESSYSRPTKTRSVVVVVQVVVVQVVVVVVVVAAPMIVIVPRETFGIYGGTD